MKDLLSELRQASAALGSAVDAEEAESLILEGLRQLCRADLAVLLEPVAPQHWQGSLYLPPDFAQATMPPLEVDWSSAAGTRRHTALERIISQKQPLAFADPIRAGEFDFSHLRLIEVAREKPVGACMLLPLRERGRAVEKIVELVRLGAADEIEPFREEELNAAAILAQQGGTVLTQIISHRELSELFESLIQLIGSAIDEKSPFAGDHCRHVPMLSMILARAVSESQQKAFKTAHLTATDLYELEVAAWLHDIGKLITPVNVTDKATKLERTIDRFDLVRTRFEILRRDLEIERLRAGEPAGELEVAAGDWDFDEMLDDLRFLADCNRGTKSLSEAETERVGEIVARYRWIDRQGGEMPVLTADEAENLKVVRGTITDAERDMIQHHVVSTINMLDMLPFPEELARVPEIAASHHEYYNGQGFPVGLKGEQMLIQSRILAFADLFASISAVSRPYKRRNTLSRSLDIMREMVDEGKVDPDLFRLFVEEGLYQQYAEEFLSRDQIDPVDPGKLLKDLPQGGS